jgi:hypothetical protein
LARVGKLADLVEEFFHNPVLFQYVFLLFVRCLQPHLVVFNELAFENTGFSFDIKRYMATKESKLVLL